MVFAVLHQQDTVTADRIADLPAPVRRYMLYTGVLGQPWTRTAKVTYSGHFRMGANKPWMPIKAVQTYSTNPPAFHWKAGFSIAGLPLMQGDDTYRGGHGHMFGKLAGIRTIFDARSDEMDQGTMIRYLNEITWFPIAYLSPFIQWQAVDDHCADVTFSDAGKSVSARMYFDDEGRMMNFVARRYREHDGHYTLNTWSTPMTAYGKMAGLNLPIRGIGVWNLPEGDLPYINIELKSVEYNLLIDPIPDPSPVVHPSANSLNGRLSARPTSE